MIGEILQAAMGIVRTVSGPFTAVVAICALLFSVLVMAHIVDVSLVVMLAMLIFGLLALLAVPVMFAMLVMVQRTTSPDT